MAKNVISIADLIREEIRNAIRSELGISGDTAATVNRDAVADVVRTVAEQSAPSTEPSKVVRRRRRGGANTAYAIANPIEVPDNFTDGVMTIYKAMAGKNGRNRKAMTEAEIIAAAGRKDASAKKAAQSAIWFLRNHDASGTRLDLDNAKDAKKAVVVNHRAGE